MADDDGSAGHRGLELGVLEQGAATGQLWAPRAAVLDEDLDGLARGGQVGEPGLDPLDGAVEGVVVGSDGDEYEGEGADEVRRADVVGPAHIRLPTSSDPR